MVRHEKSGLTGVERLKTRYRHVLTALQGDAKRYHGGIHGLASATERNGAVLCHKLCPNDASAAPTLEDFLTDVETLQSVATVNALALLVGRTTVPVAPTHRAPRDVMRAFLGLVQQAGEATAAGADAVADGVLSADERAGLEPLLDELISAAVEFRALVRGGFHGG